MGESVTAKGQLIYVQRKEGQIKKFTPFKTSETDCLEVAGTDVS